MSTRNKFVKFALPFAIVVAGVGVMLGLVRHRKAPEKKVVKNPGALVCVLTVRMQDMPVTVRATGTVRPAHSVTVIPQVTGRIQSVSSSLVTGGFFKKDDELFDIDGADYRLAVDRAEAARVNAEYGLEKMQSQAQVARAEWERLNSTAKADPPGEPAQNDPPNPLVLYGPQLKDAEAALKGAEAALEQARLNLSRTRLKAPFNSMVVSENVDPGQYVTPATTAVSLAGTDRAEIIVPLQLDDLPWVEVPNAAGKKGSSATVVMNVAGSKRTWEGTVVRSLGEVDPDGRMIRVAISVDDPYGLLKKGPKGPPLAFGSFVEARIDGVKAHGVISLPRNALRDNDTVWTVDANNAMKIKKLDILRTDQDTVLVKGGLSDGDRVVLTTLTGAADGMKLRVLEGNEGDGL